MKYEEEYKATTSMDEFVKLMVKKYKYLKKISAKRRFYDLRKKFGVQTVIIKPNVQELVVIDVNDMKKPDAMKMIIVKDLKRLKYKINRVTLRQNGFYPNEINWLKMKGYFTK